MRRPTRAVLAAAAGGVLVGALALTAASAASPNDTACVAASGTGTTWNSARLARYDACRFDRLDAAVKELGTSSPAPNPAPTVTKPTVAPSDSPAPSVTPTTTTPSPTVEPTSASPTTTPTVTPAAAICKPGSEMRGYDGKPLVFNGQGSAGLGPLYNASAEEWSVSGYNYAQTMGVCSHDAWYVDVKTDNSKGDGAVKAYPSMRAIYWDYSKADGNLPLVSSFPRLETTFASSDPASCSGCIYDTAFDVWLNGIGNGSANELMIWTHNVGQTPYGMKVASGVKVAGHTWDLWSGAQDHYLAYVPTDTNYIPAGMFDIKDFTADLTTRNRIPAATKLGQISFGVETVSTGAVTKHWDFTKFTVVSN